MGNGLEYILASIGAPVTEAFMLQVIFNLSSLANYWSPFSE